MVGRRPADAVRTGGAALTRDPEQTWEVTQQERDEWRELLQEPGADELEGRFTLPPPAEGGWREWISARWPTALGAE